MRSALRPAVLVSLAALLAPACMSVNMQDATVPSRLDTQHAQVVFYRPTSQYDAARFPVYDDDLLVGFTEASAWFEHTCVPGPHTFFLVSKHAAEAVLMADLAPGLVYYVKVTMSDREPDRYGIVYTTGALDPVTRGSPEAARGPELVAGLRHRELADRAARYAAGKKGRTEQWYVADAKRKLELGKIVAKKLSPEDGQHPRAPAMR